MVKPWVQPPINKSRLAPGGVLLGSHLPSFIIIYNAFIGILRESFEIQVLAICL